MGEVDAFSSERDFRKEILLLGVIAFSMAISAYYIPLFGLIVASLTPAPLIILFYLLGGKPGVVVVAIIFFAICLFSGVAFGSLFILQYGVMGFVIGEPLRRNCSIFRILGFGSIIPPVVWAITLLFFQASSGSSLIPVVEDVIQMNIENTMQLYKEAGIGTEQVELIRAESAGLSWFIVGALPSFLLMGAFMSTLINYSLARVAVKKRYGVEWRKIPPLKTFLLPDVWVWGLIGGALFAFVSAGPMKFVGLNIVIVMVTLYSVQGFAVISSLMEKWSLSRGARFFIYLIMFAQPLSLVLVTLLGLFDIWLDTRGVRSGDEAV